MRKQMLFQNNIKTITITDRASRDGLDAKIDMPHAIVIDARSQLTSEQ